MDLFDVFRWSLALVCTVYASVQITVTLRAWLVYFATSRETALLGRYVSVQLLRLRVRRFLPEVLQITLLLVVLLVIVWVHFHLDTAS